MFRTLKCQESSGKVTLKGQFKFSRSDCFLPVRLGRCVYRISLIKGKLKIVHQSRDPVEPSMTYRPVSKQPQYYDFNTEGEYKIDLEISMRYGAMETLMVLNKKLWDESEFIYVAEFQDVPVEK